MLESISARSSSESAYLMKTRTARSNVAGEWPRAVTMAKSRPSRNAFFNAW